MRRWLLTSVVVLAACTTSGCMTGPILENPALIRPDPSITVANPVWLPSAGNDRDAYARVFENTLDIVDDYFEIRFSDRYSGRIITFPRISPGYEQFWKPGSVDFYQRLEATLQTIRRRAEVLLQPAEDGGFFVEVRVWKELEDLPRPIRATAGAAAFRGDMTIDRQFEVIEPSVFESNWIPRGRDSELEQVILQRLRKCQ